MPKMPDSPIAGLSRKEWLLLLWNFHHGHLNESEKNRVEVCLASSEDARIDSERVNQIINELRQIGRWDPSPDFPERALSRLMPSKPFLSIPVLIGIGLAVAILLVLWFLLSGGNVDTGREPESISRSTLNAPGVDPSFLAESPFGEDLNNPPDPSNRQRLLQLRDPIPEMESDLDSWLDSPLILAPAEPLEEPSRVATP